jgi:hypothetical protein
MIALLMLVSAISSVGRVARGDQRGVPPLPPMTAGTHLPRFGAPPAQMPPPNASPPPTFSSDTIPPLGNRPLDRPNELNAPRFEPVVNLPLILLGIAGLIVLALVAVVLFANP